MILGWCMERPSVSGRGGIRIQDCILRVREWSLASDSVWGSLAGLDGAGTTGDQIGITMMFVSTITITSRTVEFSPIATTSITPAAFTGAAQPAREASPRRSMDSRRNTASRVHIPAHSAALIMEESREASPLAGSRALAEASMGAAVSMAAEVVTEEAVT